MRWRASWSARVHWASPSPNLRSWCPRCPLPWRKPLLHPLLLGRDSKRENVYCGSFGHWKLSARHSQTHFCCSAPLNVCWSAIICSQFLFVFQPFLVGLHHFPASRETKPSWSLGISGWAERSRRICSRLQRRWPTWKVNSLLAESHSCFEGKLRLWYWSVDMCWIDLKWTSGRVRFWKQFAPKSERQWHGRSAAITMRVAAGWSTWGCNFSNNIKSSIVSCCRVPAICCWPRAAHLRLNENASALELTDTIFECRGAWRGLGKSMVVWVGFTGSYKIWTNQRSPEHAGTRPGAGPIALTQTYWTRVDGSLLTLTKCLRMFGFFAHDF